MPLTIWSDPDATQHLQGPKSHSPSGVLQMVPYILIDLQDLQLSSSLIMHQRG